LILLLITEKLIHSIIDGFDVYWITRFVLSFLETKSYDIDVLLKLLMKDFLKLPFLNLKKLFILISIIKVILVVITTRVNDHSMLPALITDPKQLPIGDKHFELISTESLRTVNDKYELIEATDEFDFFQYVVEEGLISILCVHISWHVK
jgi:hypothetical protein